MNLQTILADLRAALPAVTQAVEAGVAAFDPAAAGAADFALGVAKIAADLSCQLEAIKAKAPNVDPAVWDAIADKNIEDDAAILALQMPAA